MRWRLGGPSGRANIADAVTAVEVTRGFEQAPTTSITVRDPDRTLVNHRMVDDPETFVDVDDVRYRLVKIGKAGSAVTLKFEQDEAIRLRDRKGELTASAGSVTMTGFVRRLATDADIPVARAEETGAGPGGDQHQRGADESSWDALRRLAEDIDWRTWVAPDGLMWVPDRYLASAKVPTTLREHAGGVDDIDFDTDARKPIDRVSMPIHDDGRIQVGDPLEIAGLRPVNGIWLVSKTTRSPFRTATRLELVRHER